MTDVVRLFRPSNGSEGDGFLARWCSNCARDAAMSAGKHPDDCADHELCEILARSYAYRVDDPKYPREWIYGKSGPECTAFVSIDAGAIVPRCTKTVDMFGGSGE